jgi:long-chain acyl-CoA synthetase
MDHHLAAQTPLDMFFHWEALKPEAVYMRQPVNREWREYTWGETGDQARRMAAAIQAMGFGSGDRTCILANNCAHWVMADLATMMSGCASAPAFTSMTAESVLYILNHSATKILFVGKTDNWQAAFGATAAPGVAPTAAPAASIFGAA